MTTTTQIDARSPLLVLHRSLPDSIRTLNTAGVLSSGDIHIARRVLALANSDDDTESQPLTLDEDVWLAVALAVRAPRFGHVYVDLASVAETVSGDDGRIAELPDDVWPDDIAVWVEHVAAHPLVSDCEPPLVLQGTRLYLARFYGHELNVASELNGRLRCRNTAETSRIQLVAPIEPVIEELCGDNPEQHQAVTAALTTPISVISGGPGTGKTATISKLIHVAQRCGRRKNGKPIRVLVVAPTGKAAARLNESFRDAPYDLDVTATTYHSMLGWYPGTFRFRHDSTNQLPADLVVIDEMSMVSVGDLARILAAIPRETPLIFVGDPDQLDAVEAGSVLADLTSCPGFPVTTLQHVYRFPKTIKTLADAIREGDVGTALKALNGETETLTWIDPGPESEWPKRTGALAKVADELITTATTVMQWARQGDAEKAIAATLQTRMICAHRSGPDGVQSWNRAVEEWVHDAPEYRRPEWYAGRPIMVTRNDRPLGIYNGDIGVAVDSPTGLRVHIDGRSETADGRRGPIAPRRLGYIQTVHAMTIHKSQGSAFDHVIVSLPVDPSPILTRQLLYTAVTRARRAVTIIATKASLTHAITNSVVRSSGLTERLTPI